MQRGDVLDRCMGGAVMKHAKSVSPNARGNGIPQRPEDRPGTGSYDFWREAEIRYQETKQLLDGMYWIASQSQDFC